MFPQIDPLHAARLAMLEGALRSLLREAGAGLDANDIPDAIAVGMDKEGVTITYLRGGMPVGEEFV